MANINNIVNVQIDIQSPAADSASFDNLLIVGLPPVNTPPKVLPDVGVYSALSEVEEAGFKTTGDDADAIGVAARIAFSQSPKPTQIFIAALKEGDANILEKPTDALSRALGTSGWYAVCTAGIDESEYEPIAEWTEAQTKIFCYTFLSDEDPVGKVFYRSIGYCGLINADDLPADVPKANYFINVAAVAKCLSYPAGSETWAYQRLSGVYPSNLGSTLEKKLVDGNSNYFTEAASRDITINGQVRAGEWIDVIRGRDWLQNDMQLQLFSLLIANPKVPFTNSGIALVQGVMTASLTAAQERGIVAEEEFDEDGNAVPGFTVSVPNSLNITATQKASRVLSDCTFSARMAGAIHVVNVNGALAY